MKGIKEDEQEEVGDDDGVDEDDGIGGDEDDDGSDSDDDGDGSGGGEDGSDCDDEGRKMRMVVMKIEKVEGYMIKDGGKERKK